MQREMAPPMMTSNEALNDWHMNTYHKHAKEWAVRSGAIMEDITQTLSSREPA
jgi:hypothetical protein